MLSGKYVSYKRILEKLHQNYGFKDRVEWSVMLEWMGDAMDLIGNNDSYIQKVTGMDAITPTIKIVDYRGELPCDLYKCLQAREFCSKSEMRYTSDSFHLSKGTARVPNFDNNSDYTYQLTNSHIFTNFATGEVEMEYIAFPIDNEGFPMIPDDVKFIRAAVDFIAWSLARKLWMEGTLDKDKFLWIEVETAWAVGSAQTRGTLQNLDQAETMKNALLRSIPKINEHSDGFAYLGQGEERFIR